jgi:hypothetical protein
LDEISICILKDADFSSLIARPRLDKVPTSSLSSNWEALSPSENSPMSSANARLDVTCSPVLMPRRGLRSHNAQSVTALNRIGLSGSPYLTPVKPLG